MFVQRNINKVKLGSMDELIQACNKVTWFSDRKITVRVYTPVFGPLNVIVFEFEYENQAAYEKTNAEWLASPECAAFTPKWLELVERGGYSEGWIRI